MFPHFASYVSMLLHPVVEPENKLRKGKKIKSFIIIIFVLWGGGGGGGGRGWEREGGLVFKIMGNLANCMMIEIYVRLCQFS